MKKAILFLIIVLNFACSSSYLKKGGSMIGIDIYPELIWADSPVSQCLSVLSTKTFAVIFGTGKVSVVEIQNDELHKVLDKNLGFEFPCKEYFSLPDNHLVWGYGVRDFQILDLNTGLQETHVVTACGNDMIYATSVIDSANLKIWIDIAHHSFKKTDSNDIAMIYDAIEHQIIETIYGYSGKIYRLEDNLYLYEIWEFPKPTVWKVSRELNNAFSSNNLTDKLSEFGLNVLPKAFNSPINFMIGHCDINDLMTFCTISWENDFKDISIQPLTIQIGKNKSLWKEFEISPDGKWAKTVARDMKSSEKTDTITFFAVNDTFPQSLSLPVYGGVSSRNGGGCFVETGDWGTVYVDITPEMPGYLVVYKMRDVMDKVIEKTRKLTQ